MQAWTTRDSKELYNIDGWGSGFFGINERGNVVLRPNGVDGSELDLKKVVDDLVRRGLSLPMLIRCSDVLRQRVSQIAEAFHRKIAEFGYEGGYQPVMPIKVNQQRHVVEELLEYGEPYGLGLEAGSKPELLIALTLMQRKDGLIICNGYKDKDYIETALLSQRLGYQTILIVDRFEELRMIIEASQRMNLQPLIGMRAKLSAKGSGKWAESGGDRSKFGLTAAEIVDGVELLEREGMLDRLICLHFHIGSQITAIRAIKDALREASRLFVSLYKMGAPLRFLDVGGGLAVDYDGSKTNFHASKNYSLDEYAADIVDSMASTLDNEEVPHPTILSESGRALVAHHAVLVFNVLGRTAPSPQRVDLRRPPRDDEPQVLQDLRESFQSLNRKNYQEVYHDAMQLKEDGLSMFRHGILDLRQRAELEELFWATVQKIWRIVRELDYVPEELAGMQKQLSDTYYCNFSVFQSVPDAWAVGHLFPVIPLHRLNEKPTRLGILADLTCDSDGKVDHFIDLHDVKDALELHDVTPNEPYFLGIFLVGAYQEVLGDLHNLFGDVNAVHIQADAESENGYLVRHVIKGDTVREVLSYVEYDDSTMLSRLRHSVERALTQGRMTFEESAMLVKHFEAGLLGYTYLESPEIATALLNSLVPRASTEAEPTPSNDARAAAHEEALDVPPLDEEERMARPHID